MHFENVKQKNKRLHDFLLSSLTDKKVSFLFVNESEMEWKHFVQTFIVRMLRIWTRFNVRSEVTVNSLRTKLMKWQVMEVF